MMAWLQVWWIVIHGLFSQMVYPFPGPRALTIPPPITGMLIWYEADVGSNCSGGACSDGSTQDTWADQSGNANTGLGNNTQSVGVGTSGTKCGAGVYHTNQINGKPAVTFASATPTCFSFTSGTGTLTASSLFAVVTWTSACTYASGATSCDITGSNGGGINWKPSSSANHPFFSKACVVDIGTSSATVSSGTWYQQNLTYDASSGAYSFRVNRSAGGSGTNSQTLTGEQTGIGGNGCYSTGEYLEGQIAEFILYNRVLTGGEITTVETYLNGKYGL